MRKDLLHVANTFCAGKQAFLRLVAALAREKGMQCVSRKDPISVRDIRRIDLIKTEIRHSQSVFKSNFDLAL